MERGRCSGLVHRFFVCFCVSLCAVFRVYYPACGRPCARLVRAFLRVTRVRAFRWGVAFSCKQCYTERISCDIVSFCAKAWNRIYIPSRIAGGWLRNEAAKRGLDRSEVRAGQKMGSFFLRWYGIERAKGAAGKPKWEQNEQTVTNSRFGTDRVIGT